MSVISETLNTAMLTIRHDAVEEIQVEFQEFCIYALHLVKRIFSTDFLRFHIKQDANQLSTSTGDIFPVTVLSSIVVVRLKY